MKRSYRIICILVVCIVAVAIMPISVSAASLPKKPQKCPKCHKNYTIVRTTTYPKTLTQKNKKLLKREGVLMYNDSKVTLVMGAFKSKTSSETYKFESLVTWKSLRLSDSYTKTDSKTTGAFAGGKVKPGYWCNTYVAHYVDCYRVEKITKDKCSQCNYCKTIQHEVANIQIPKKTNGVELKFVTSKKKANVNKSYL